MSTNGKIGRSDSLRRSCVLTLVAFALLGAIGVGGHGRAAAATAHELSIIAHAETPVRALSAYEMEAIFTRSQTRWSDGTAVVPLNAPAGSDTRTAFDRAVLRLEPDEVGRFWLDRRIRGLGLPPRHVADPALTLKVVANLKGAIGYVQGEPATPKVRVVARIRNGRLVGP